VNNQTAEYDNIKSSQKAQPVYKTEIVENKRQFGTNASNGLLSDTGLVGAELQQKCNQHIFMIFCNQAAKLLEHIT
jgi:hypothetical protein